MRAAFWMGTSAVGLRKQDSYLVFDSSHDDRPSEQEVPIPMVALVGAAVCPHLLPITLVHSPDLYMA